MKTKIILVVFIFLMAVMQMLYAQTHKSGNINGETWNSSGNPYIVDSNILVASLIIHPGVHIIFAGNYEFQVAGILTAVGSPCDSILFLKADTISGWNGIFFNYCGSTSEMAFCRVSNSINSGIKIVYSNPNIHHCKISDNWAPNEGAGINVISPTPIFRIQNCIISNNTLNANLGTLRGGGIVNSI